MIFQHPKIHHNYHLKCLCVACYDHAILDCEEHLFAISCCIATLIQDARDRGVAVEPIIQEFLGTEPEPGLSPAQLYDAYVASSDAWALVSARLREAWQTISADEISDHYARSLSEGLSHLPQTEGLPFGNEEFDCMTFEEWLERLSEVE